MKVLLFGAFLLVVLFSLKAREGFSTTPSEILNNQNKVFVLFYNKDCGHCKELKPIWEKVQANNVEVMSSVDLTNSDAKTEEVSKKFNITAYPTMLVIENGKVLESYNGERTVDALSNFVKNM
jgi:thioredoxin-like negative regulator of GroEL